MTENNGVEIALSDFERKKLVEQIYISFPRLNRVYSLVEHCHHHSKIAAEPECLLITGRQGAGKTTLRQLACDLPTTHGSFGGGLLEKCSIEQLAGSLPYRKHGS